MVVSHGMVRIFRAGGRGSSAETGTNLPCGFGLKMVETRRRSWADKLQGAFIHQL